MSYVSCPPPKNYPHRLFVQAAYYNACLKVRHRLTGGVILCVSS